MSLTITEKQHWKNRIETRINEEIRKLKATDPEFFRSVNEKAHQAAVAKLGIADAYATLRDLKDQLAALHAKREKLETDIAKQFHRGYFHNAAGVIETAIKEVSPLEEERLMNESPLGEWVVNLGKKRESFADTLWLATSLNQVNQLWQQLDSLLMAGFQES